MAEYRLPYSKDVLAEIPSRIEALEQLVAQLQEEIEALKPETPEEVTE